MISNPIRLARYLLAGWLPGGSCLCVLCGREVWRFMPYRDGAGTALMAAIGGVGSDARNFECPRCGAHDRERHLLLYMRAAGLIERLPSMRVLHFAPERRLSPVIERVAPSRYVQCDLYPNKPGMLNVDIEAMPFEGGEFDLVIANHVLEHVADDLRAAREIHRVLVPGGMAILQTPYSPLLHATWSDAGIESDEARLQAYGQEDHVRLFGRDVFDRIASSGLVPEVATHQQLLLGVDPQRFGVNPLEPFFLFKREA